MLSEPCGAHSLRQHKTECQFYVVPWEEKKVEEEENLQVTDLLCDDVSVFVCELFLADLLPRNVLNLVTLQMGKQVCSAHSRVIFVFLWDTDGTDRAVEGAESF